MIHATDFGSAENIFITVGLVMFVIAVLALWKF